MEQIVMGQKDPIPTFYGGFFGDFFVGFFLMADFFW